MAAAPTRRVTGVRCAQPAASGVAGRGRRGEAAATSAPGALLLGRAGHILSPHGAESVGFETVTVAAPTATLADGLSTALCAAGPGRAAAIMARAPEARMLARAAHGGEMRLGRFG